MPERTFIVPLATSRIPTSRSLAEDMLYLINAPDFVRAPRSQWSHLLFILIVFLFLNILILFILFIRSSTSRNSRIPPRRLQVHRLKVQHGPQGLRVRVGSLQQCWRSAGGGRGGRHARLRVRRGAGATR